MKQDLESCEFCGCVVDIEKLKIIESKVTIESEKYIYRDFYDFEKWVCPACKKQNQR